MFFLNATCEVFGSQHQRPAAHALIYARVNSKPFFFPLRKSKLSEASLRAELCPSHRRTKEAFLTGLALLMSCSWATCRGLTRPRPF